MIEQFIQDTTLIFIVASIIFGLIGGIALTCLVLAGLAPKIKSGSRSKQNSIRLWKPCKQRRETLKRATRNARLMVAGGSIDIPARRRA